MTTSTEAAAAPGRVATDLPFSHVVHLGAALVTAGAAFLHLDAAGDHTEHAHIAAFFVAAALTQLALAGAVALGGRSDRARPLALAVNGGLLVTWLFSRTTGLPFVSGAEDPEAIGWKDAAASGLELSSLAMLFLAAAMPAAACAALVPAMRARRLLAGVATCTLALVVPGVLAAHEDGHGHDDVASAAHGHGEGELAGAVHVHDEPAAPGEPEHVHAEVSDGVPGGSHDGNHGHGAAPTAGHDGDDGSHDGEHGTHTVDDGAHPHSPAADPFFAGPPAPDPLAGPGKITTVRVGPLPLLPQIGGADMPHLSPLIPGATPGRLNLVPLVGIPSPCQDCYVLGVQPDLVYADGSRANLDTGPMLHHLLVADPARADAVCGRDTMVGQLGQRVFASGNERTGAALPSGFGVPVSSSSLTGAVEIMNMSDQLRTVYIQITLRWVPMSTPGILPATPVWLDIDSCGDSEVDLPAGVSDTTWDWRSNLTGRIVAAGGHVHDGGTWIGLTNATSGEHVCNSIAGYGTDPGYMGTVEDMTVCAWDRLAVVRAGDVLRLNAHYNVAAPVNGAMGIMMIFVHETDDLASGAPSPYPAQPPPDGPPPGGHQHGH